MREVTIALAQVQPVNDMEASARLAYDAMDQAAAQGAEVICFPEIHLGPFFPQYAGGEADQYCIPLSHALIDGFRQRCRALALTAFPNVYLAENGRAFDATIAIGPDGEILGVSKMVHIVQAPQFYEQDYYAPSDTGFRVYQTPVGRVAVVICFDRHFPESIRTVTLGGADLVLIPTANAIAEPLELFDWELRVAASQNGVFIACCNRVGSEGAMQFAGGSIVAGPAGDLVAQAGPDAQLLVAKIDLNRTAVERGRRPYLALRRPDQYHAG